MNAIPATKMDRSRPGTVGRRSLVGARRHLHTASAIVLVILLTLAGTVSGVAAQTTPTPAIRLRLVSIPLSIHADEALPIVVGAVGDVPSDGVIVVTAFAPVTSRQQVATINNGNIPSRSVGAISIPVTGLPRDDNGAFVIPVVTQSETKLKNKLRLKDPGLYPLSIELRDSDSGGTLTGLTTFVERLGSDQPPSQVSIGWLFTVDGAPTLQADGTTTVTDATRKQLGALATFLQQTAVPISVIIRPELLDGLQRSGNPADLTLLTQLATALGSRHELLAEPSISMDPAAAARTGLQSIFTDQLRLGEDQLSASLGVNVAKRSSWYVPSGTDAGGLGLLRGLGVQHVVINQQATTPQAVGTPTGELGKVALAEDQSIPALVTDDTVQNALHAATDDPIAAAHGILADLTALGIERDQQLNTTGSGPARGVVVAAGSVGDIDPVLLQDVFELLQQSSHIALRTVDGVLDELVRGTSNADIRAIEPINTRPIDLRNVALTLNRLDDEIASFAVMLPSIPVDPRPAEWRRLMEVYPADNLSDTERRNYTDKIDAALGDLRASVTWPQLGHITIGGRTSDIPFVLDNSSDVDLKVLLRLSSAKMDFPGDQLVTVGKRTSSNGRTSIDIRVTARSGAEFPVTVQLFTPDGKYALGPPKTLTVRASVLTGLGQVATGALLVILASWWIQNYVRSRRKRRSAATAASLDRHPVKNGSATSMDVTTSFGSPDGHQDDDTGPNGIPRPSLDDSDDESELMAARSDKVPDS